MANVHKLLHDSSEGVDLLTKLELQSPERRLLQTAKAKIREHLRVTISEGTKDRLGVMIAPRFFTQGSEAYKTLNRPAWMPPQQMDLDDGVYLPMTFVKGATRPSQAAAIFFAIVDSALKALVKREGWKAFDDTKDTCARVIINDTAYVDVPLYAIPDDEFGKLTKAAMDARVTDSADFDFMRSRIDRRDSWDVLPSDKVLLAHRKEDWKPSDPRKVHEWFLASIEDFGERLRRECRYLKAWRDHHKLDISSIILMVCAWQVFEEIGQLHIPTRDDLMLLKIAERLPDLFSSEIRNPAADDNEILGANWSHASRTAAIQAARRMIEDLDMALNHCWQTEAAVTRLRNVFGSRIPNRPDLVSVKAAAVAAVAAAPTLYTPAPEVGRSTSG